MIIGYLQISNTNGEKDIQRLKNAGCEDIFIDEISSNKKNRIDELLKSIKEGDTLVILHLFSLGGNVVDVINTLIDLYQKRVNLVSLSDNVELSVDNNSLAFAYQIFTKVKLSLQAEEEQRLKQISKLGGRPKGLSQSSLKKAKLIYSMYDVKNKEGNYKYSISDIEKKSGVSRPTIYRYLKKNNIPLRG